MPSLFGDKPIPPQNDAQRPERAFPEFTLKFTYSGERPVGVRLGSGSFRPKRGQVSWDWAVGSGNPRMRMAFKQQPVKQVLVKQVDIAVKVAEVR